MKIRQIPAFHPILSRAGTLCAFFLVVGTAAVQANEPPKKAAPAARPAAAAPSHGPATASSATAHGPTTSAPGGAHGPTTTTAGAAHGPTTSGGAHITTSSPGAARTTSAPGGAMAHAATPGTHPGAPSSFGAHPAPSGSHELHAANGAAVRTRADGTRSDIHDPKRGMDIHHGLNGNRRVAVERPDHTRIVADRGGRGYVQHPYNFHGHEFGHRTYYEHGRAYDRFYGRYPYRGGYLDVYAPARFYPYGFYGYAYAPWAAPVPYAWGWGGAPWYGYYGAYYAPYPVYPAPAFWLADFVFAASLAAAYEAGAASADLAPSFTNPPTLLGAAVWLTDQLVEPAEAAALSATPMNPDVKQSVTDEIKAMVQREGDDAQANAAQKDIDPNRNSIAQLLADNQPHVLVAGSDLDLVASTGQECAFSQGDVVKVLGPPPADADSLNATVLASKGGKECALAQTVAVPVSDLQDMENHMREQVDDGLAELQKKQGKGGLPSAPAGASGPAVPAGFAAAAPPPDANAKDEISQQASAADQAENEAAAGATADPGASAGSPATIALGQSVDTVTATLGNPTRIIDLGAKKIYTYPDMKIIFMNGKVASVE